MNRFSVLIVALVVVVMASPSVAAAQDSKPLPSPLALADVIRIASERRDEIQAARARTRAAEARLAIVSALPDPMISPPLDHLVMLGGLWSCGFLTLLVLPAAYAMWRRHQVRATLSLSMPHDAATTFDGPA